MRKSIGRFLFWLMVAAAVTFSVFAFVRVSATSDPAVPPGVSEAPARVYGFVEPAGREVFICPPVSRRVVEVLVAQGDPVGTGEIICRLDDRVERRDLEVARARVKASRKALELSRDEFNRKKGLYADQAISEADFVTSRLMAELDSANLAVAEEEVKRYETLLAQLELTSPIDGMVYKLDVRLGEMMVAGGEGECPIVVGSADLWVRLYVESFWAGRLEVGDRYDVRDAETGETIGRGVVIEKAPYLGRKSFQTDEPGERFDTGYREFVLELETSRQDIPLGLSVTSEVRQGDATESGDD
jgi:multidrug efflux pump subunit AcrA (membrane-fusion protein)